MKKSVFLLIPLLFLQLNLLAQHDTLIGENTFKYKIHDGKITPYKHVAIQNTYDLDDNLLWQTVFIDSLMNIKEYTAYIYVDELLRSVETYNNIDSVIAIKRYTYASNGNLTNKHFYNRINDNIKLVKFKKYHYNDTLLVRVEVFNSKKKWLKKTNYTYTDSTIVKSTEFRKKFRDDKLANSQTTSIVKNGNTQKSIIIELYSSDKTDKTVIEYEYDEKINKLIKEIWKDDSDSILKMVEYRYNKDTGEKIGEGLLDESGNYLQFLGFLRKKRSVIMKEVKMYNIEQNK